MSSHIEDSQQKRNCKRRITSNSNRREEIKETDNSQNVQKKKSKVDKNREKSKN